MRGSSLPVTLSTLREKHRRYLQWLYLSFGAVAVLLSGVSRADTQLTAADARSRALEFNRGYLSAREEVNKAQGDIGRARAGAFPEITLHGGYARNFEIASLFIPTDEGTMEWRTGFKNSFNASISLRQPLWEGGKVYTAYSVAKQYKRYSEAMTDEVAQAVVCNAELLFYSAILEKARLAVLNQAYETYTHNLEVVEKFYSQGLVSRFELLRARVEQSNLKPQMLAAESQVRLSEKWLKSFIGLALDEAVRLVEEPDDTSLADLPPLQTFVDSALAVRPEIRQAELYSDMRRKAVTVARAGYFPSLAAVSTYSWQSQADEFTMKRNTSNSWTAGIDLTVPIFDGGLTRSEVGKARAEHRQSRLAAQQLRDDIRLEVEQAYDRLLQVREALDTQGETIAEAEEGVRIAKLRYEAGEGTLLEVLSAQTALTQAGTTLAEATFAFRSARVSLQKATTIDIDAE